MAVLAGPVHAGAADSPLLTLGQLAGKQGCVSDRGEGDHCARGSALDFGINMGPRALAASPDGQNVYAAATGSNSVVAFRRDAATGGLTQIGCVSEPRHGECEPGLGLAEATGVAVSPDGRQVYATSRVGRSVVTFQRDPGSGLLRQTHCVSDGAASEQGCEVGRGLYGAASVTVSPDGRHVYVAATLSSALTTFARSPDDGSLTQTGCLADGTATGGCVDTPGLESAFGLAVSPDGLNVYVTALQRDSVLNFTRDAQSGQVSAAGCTSDREAPSSACGRAAGINNPEAVAIAPRGDRVYVASSSSSALTVFGRGTGTGGLDEIGCLGANSLRGHCEPGNQLVGAGAVDVSPDGREVFVASGEYSHSLSRFVRSGSSEVGGGCISEDGTFGACVRGRALLGAKSVITSPDGRDVYVAGYGSDAVTSFSRTAGLKTREARVGRRGNMRLAIVCPRRASRRCTGRITLRSERRVRTGRGRRRVALGGARYSVARGKTGRPRLRLRRAQIGLLPARFVAIARLADARGTFAPIEARLRVVR
jgi:DNA-binding beta-propeller fold protein YncE